MSLGDKIDYRLHMEYHGYERDYTMAEVDAMTDSDKEMEVWEEAIRKEESAEDEEFLKAMADGKDVSLTKDGFKTD